MLLAAAAILLALSAEPSTGVVAEERVVLGTPLSGADFLLIAEAVRHRTMRGANLACYQIYVFDRPGGRSVAFLEARERMIEQEGPEGSMLVFLPPDPNCRSITFEMNGEGRVSKVIYSRH